VDLSVQSYLEIPAGVDGACRDDAGCSAALRDCLTQNYDRLHRRLARYLGCPDQASDSLHDAWLRLGEMALPESVGHPEAYVYRVACNLALDRLRSNRAWQSLEDFEELDALVDPLPGPDRIAEARSELAEFERAMQSLPDRCQSVLFDLRVNELTRHEVATRFDLSLRRVDTVLRQTLDYCAQRTHPHEHRLRTA
jgi:RNA polymerase sigma factor (sigma-70 family)